MKKLFLFAAVQIAIIAVPHLTAQTKLALNDQSGLITPEVETFLKERLEADGIELTTMVDYRKKCDYWFAGTSVLNNELILTVNDCHDKPAGIRNIGTRVMTAADNEKALLLYFAISEIVKEPGKFLPVTEKPAPEPAYSTRTSAPVLEQVDPGIHKTRYFFSPSSFSLEEGELYYNTLYFFTHDLQYGVSEEFSRGMGTTIGMWPFYLTPKLSIPVNDISSFALGDLLMIGTWGTKFFGNLLYATYTVGGERKNMTVGGGYLYTGDGEITSTTHTPVLNLSGLAEFSDHIYFISENYITQVALKETAYHKTDYRSEIYSRNMFAIFGMSGFRFINRRKDVISWQLGLAYLYSSFGPVPDKYNPIFWETYTSSFGGFMAFPIIGYTRKFGMKY